MRSPFPGMDPYLERHWRDVHADLIALTRTALNEKLPDDLIARMEERVVIDSVGFDRPRVVYPDVRVYEDPSRSATATVGAGAAVAEPIVLTVDAESHTETYVTILGAEGGELVTVLECLSPTNKLPGDDRSQYIRKRRELVDSRVNVVEIDLIRQGSWQEMLQPVAAPARVRSEYRTVIWRADPRGRVELYPMPLRSRLPIIPIPLRPTDAAVHLDLQTLVDQAYRNGRYDHTDYSKPCEPALEAEDAQWARELIAAQQR
jgi:hypothetical protein